MLLLGRTGARIAPIRREDEKFEKPFQEDAAASYKTMRRNDPRHQPSATDNAAQCPVCVPIGDISMLFNRLASLRDQDRREMIHAKNLPRNSPASCLRGIANDLRQRMRQNKNASPSCRSYCRRSGRLSGPRKPNPCQRTLAGSGKVMLGKRSNSMGSRMTPTVRRDRCAPAQ
jgi:hypothetical protein